jgi:hypothetical protein
MANVLRAAACLSLLAIAAGTASAEGFDGGAVSETVARQAVLYAGGCAAVLVHPRVAVLPAHCISGSHQPLEHLERLARDGRRTVAARIERCTPHPSHTLALADFDIAVCVLDQPLSGLAVIPVTDVRPVVNAAAQPRLQVVGYGGNRSGDKRVSSGVLQAQLVQLRTPATAVIRTAERSGCYGDSGAAVFVEDATKGYRLFGIVVGGDAAACRGNSVAVRLSHYLDWIRRESKQPDAGH